MVVFNVYFARSGAGRAVAVGSGVNETVGKGANVATGVKVAATGAAVDAEVGDVQEDKINTSRKRTEIDKVMFLRMGCIVTKNLLPGLAGGANNKGGISLQ